MPPCPVQPIHAISKRGMLTAIIKPIQIRVVAFFVPPGSFELNGAVIIMIIIILISCGEWHIPMQSERVTSIS